MHLEERAFTAVLATLAWLVPTSAHAHRPRFEPTDLEWEATGMTELDLEMGTIRGADAWRTVAPDFELDLGLLPNFELDIDGAFNVEGRPDGPPSLDQPSPDNLWIAAKLGLWDTREEGQLTGWAFGAQIGPKLPAAPNAHGIGYEGLLLAGHTWGESHLVLNVGGLVDPGEQVSKKRPAGVEGGFDLEVQLGHSPISITGELAGIRYFSADPNQLNATAGVTFAAGDFLDLSVVGIVGFLRGGDRGGVLLGVSPKIALWK